MPKACLFSTALSLTVLALGCATSSRESAGPLPISTAVGPGEIIRELLTLEVPSEDNNPNQEAHIAVQTALSLGDLNGDGEPDFFVLPNRTAVRARLFVSYSGGYRPTARSYEYGYYAKALDWNDDGRPDLLIKGGQANERKLKIFRIDQSPGIADPDSRISGVGG